MAIALDTAGGNYARTASGTTHNLTFNNAAGDFLVIGFCHFSNTDKVTSVTYNGVAMTLAKKQLGTSEYGHLYYLNNPATGSNTLTVTLSSSDNLDYGIASYTGVATSSPVDGTVGTTIASGASATITETITSTADNCWMCAFSGGQRTSAASTGSTRRSGNTGGGQLYDNNAAITPAGSNSMVQTIGSSGPATGVAFTFKPATSGGANTTNFFLMM